MAIIMIAQARERLSYYHKPLLPALHHGGSVGDVGEVGEATGDDSGSVSPSNLHRFSLYFVVSCFSAASSRECLGESLIGVLGQPLQSEIKTDGIGGTKAKQDQVAQPGLGTATHAHLSLVGLHMCFFFSCSCSGKNNHARKILSPFEFRKVPET
jgi:hypothetical protein